MKTDKLRLLLYGNCQGEWYAQMLRLQPPIAERYEVLYLANFGEWPADHPARTPGFFESCGVVLWQTAAGCKPPDFLPRLSTDCRQIRFPTLALKVLWPFHAQDPRNVPEPGFPFGRFSYGDGLLMRLREQGVATADLPQRYCETDLSTLVDLDRYAALAFAELRSNDRRSDIAVAPLIEAAFRERRLFHTINHAAFSLLEPVCRLLESALLEAPAREPIAWPDGTEDCFNEQQIPIHPQIVRHFGLRWVPPGMKWRYHSALLTLDEYVRAYADFTPIPRENPPRLWLDRAALAASLGDFAEARRLLLTATASFPCLHQFLQALALLHQRAGQPLEAEKVLRYALTKHSHVAVLHYKLGEVLLQRDFAGEAQSCFRQALQLAPGLAEAKQQLERLQRRIGGPDRSAA